MAFTVVFIKISASIAKKAAIMTLNSLIHNRTQVQQNFYRVSLLSLGVKSVAIKSLLSMGSNRIQELVTPSSALAALNDPWQIVVLDGAVVPSAAALQIRKWGLVEALARRVQQGNSLLACGESAIALGFGELDGNVRGLGVAPFRIGRAVGDCEIGLREIDSRNTDRAWFSHDYLIIPSMQRQDPSENFSFSYGDVRCITFDPARSGVYGRSFVCQWISSCIAIKGEAA